MAKRGKKRTSRPVSIRAVPKKQQPPRAKRNDEPAAKSKDPREAQPRQQEQLQPRPDVAPQVDKAPQAQPWTLPQTPAEMPVAPIQPVPVVPMRVPEPGPGPAPVAHLSAPPTAVDAIAQGVDRERALFELLEAEPPHLPPSPDDDGEAGPQPTLLFQIAWAVCWQLAGIYTVRPTKPAAMLARGSDSCSWRCR